MVKSTASQQQDTIRDMNRPKSWTAGIWQWKGRGDGRGSGLESKEPRDSAALGPDHPQTAAGCKGRGCWNEGTGPGGCQRAGLEPGVWQRGRVQPPVDTAALCPEQCWAQSKRTVTLQEGQRKTHTVRAGHTLAEGKREEAATGCAPGVSRAPAQGVAVRRKLQPTSRQAFLHCLWNTFTSSSFHSLMIHT